MVGTSIKYPIYIISKGRYSNPLTAKMFLRENIHFKIAVEPQEYELYKKMIPQENILVLPFSNLGLGSYPARNYCWEHSIKEGFKKHWLFDDNIRNFYRLVNGKRVKYNALESITYSESFLDRYSNIGIAGFNYVMFGVGITKPFRYNVHVYSGMLITNNIPFRWRLKYNEDVDLCLQILDSGLCTLAFNAFLIQKTSTTAKMKGGNQTELYQGNKYEKKVLKAKSLQEVWPQYAETVYRFNRPHHFVNWKKHFKQPLIKVKNAD